MNKFLLLLVCCSITVQAQTVRLIVPYTPGGVTDRSARVTEKTLADKLPYNFIVEYQLGAGGIIAANNVAKNNSKETVLLVHSSAIVANTFNPASTYDLFRDFVPVAKIGTVPMVLVLNRLSGVTNIQQLKQFNSPMFYATAGPGTAMHIAGELLQLKINKNIVPVAYKGESAAFNDILSNSITMMFVSSSIVTGHVNSTQVSMIAITGTQRNVDFPTVPTFVEQGIRGFDRSPNWIVVLANPGADRTMISQIKVALSDSVKNTQDRVLYHRAGVEPDHAPTVGVQEFLADEIEKIKIIQNKVK
jgi:tripartite-type tricarboxylate transporter receptor subunit TctC